jgi:hypothetical protein
MREDIEAELQVAAGRVALGWWELLGAGSAEPLLGPRARTDRQARWLAGLLWQASETLVDQLLDDVMALRAEPDAAAWPHVVEHSQVLRGLPPRFWHRITPVVAAKMLVVAVDLTARVARGWTPPSCVAQELMLRCLLDEVASLAGTHQVGLDEDWRDRFEDALFEDVDHEMLYDPAADGFEDDPGFPRPPGMAPMGFESWFVPFNPERRLPPFAEDQSPDNPA